MAHALILALPLMPLLFAMACAAEQPGRQPWLGGRPNYVDPRLPPSPLPPEVPILPPPGGRLSLGEELRAEQRLLEVERDAQLVQEQVNRGADAQRLRDLGILRGEQQHLRGRLQR